ncbi:MAG: Hsp70 family protein [Prevotellaceae bacterium]|jgi:molecular chaperone DnaK|nr:Hsp70 family protein [Prevotellaceae bacterium]
MRNKIDYGIDLGTTNSAIARMENGIPVIKKSDTLKDTVPSCVSFNKRKDVLVGDAAFNVMKTDSARALKTFEKGKTNTFIEFKRTMGTTTTYESTNMGKEFLSYELSAEVLKKLKSLIQDENLSSVVITIPAKFGNQQKEATMKAAKAAGFKQVQLLQEPVAAATAYGLGSKSKDGFWLVFDFGGGTFDAALVKAEEGLLSVKDTEGDNWLGGKNLDEAIVDQILIPYLQENYKIDSILENSDKKQMLRVAMKYYAEDAKNQLSFKDKYSVLSNLGDLPFEDENGEEPEIDLEITVARLEEILSPLFQKAIDITKDLLKRNNLKGSNLDKLILVGGPTYSPILRKMLKEQVTENVDTSVDPMTVVACGAALYASTIDVTDEIQDETRDETKLQLEIKYEAASVETEELVNIKVLKEKSTGNYPDELFAEFVRSDGAWSSPKKAISDKKAALMEVQLVEGRSNSFTINIYDNQGNRIDCEPNQFIILQGIGGLDGMQVLASHICIVKHFADEEKDLILPVKGLEKNNRYPATGVTNGLKTRQAIRPGMAKDVIRIPIYEGEYNATRTNPDLNNLIFEVIITGESLPALLPEGSDIDITIKVDKSGLMKFSAYFPALDHTEELEIPVKAMAAPEASELTKKINNAKRTAQKVNASDISGRLKNLENQLENEKGSTDGRLKILDGLRKELLQLETLEKATEFPKVEKELKEAFFDFEDLIQTIKRNGDTNNVNISQIDNMLAEIKQRVDSIIKEKNIGEAKALTQEIFSLDYNLRNSLTGGSQDAQMLQLMNEGFGSFHWKDATKARQLINKGLQMIQNGNNNVRPILAELVQLIPRGELPTDTLG